MRSVGVDLFKLGVSLVLLALMFPLIEAVDKYVGTGTSAVTMILWFVGTILVLASAFMDKGPDTGKGG